MLETLQIKQKYHDLSSTEDMRPPGTYCCPECKNVVIRWNAPVKKFKLNCPKCSGDLQLVESEATVAVFKLLGHEVKEYGLVKTVGRQVKRIGSALSRGAVQEKGLRSVKRRMKAVSKVPKPPSLATAMLGSRKKSLSRVPKFSGPLGFSKSCPASKEYTKRGLKPPNGKGIHTKKFHEVSAAVMKKGGVKSRAHAHAIAMSKLGSKKGVKKAHQKKPVTIGVNKQGHSMLPPYKPFNAQMIDALHYGIKKAIGGWKIGFRDGILEAEGKKSPPGAIHLAGLKFLHGNSYILGRQHALARAGMHGGTMEGRDWANSLTDFITEISTEGK